MSIIVTKSLLLRKIIAESSMNKDNFISIKDEPFQGSHNICKEEDVDDKFFLSAKKICRLCETSIISNDWHYIFQKINGLDIKSAIRIVTNITVKEDDWYPKYVCAVCLVELQAALTFVRKCHDTDMKFRQIIGMDNLTSSSFIRHDFTLLLHKMARGIKVFKTKEAEKEKSNTPSREPTPLPLPTPLPPPPPSPEVLEDIKREEMPQEELPQEEPADVKPLRKKKKTKMKKVKKGKLRAYLKKMICIKCDMEFEEEEKFKEHRDQSACKRTQCPHCEKTVLNLRIHLRRMHPSGPVFQCEHCDRAYPIMSELTRHMLVHTNRYDFPCPQCDYRGKRKEYLKLHMRSHGPERYLCAECPATFINQSNFNKHRLVHGNKQYQCVKCKKSFRYAKQLQTHDEAQHQKIRHPCTVCGQIFKYRNKLLKHELKVHNREKRKLNPHGAVLRPEGDSRTELGSAAAPLEAFLHFKKDREPFHSRSFDGR